MRPGYQKTVDYPYGWGNGNHVILDTRVLVTVRCGQLSR